MAQAHSRHNDAPRNHNDGNENAGTKAFEQDIRQGLEKGVRDEEDGDAGIVLAGGDV